MLSPSADASVRPELLVAESRLLRATDEKLPPHGLAVHMLIHLYESSDLKSETRYKAVPATSRHRQPTRRVAAGMAPYAPVQRLFGKF